MILFVHGFQQKTHALQFEWAWQHPSESLIVRDSIAQFQRKHMYGLVGKVRILYQMLHVAPFKYYPLKVQYCDSQYKHYAKDCPAPPSHISALVSPLDYWTLQMGDQSERDHNDTASQITTSPTRDNYQNTNDCAQPASPPRSTQASRQNTQPPMSLSGTNATQVQNTTVQAHESATSARRVRRKGPSIPKCTVCRKRVNMTWHLCGSCGSSSHVSCIAQHSIAQHVSDNTASIPARAYCPSCNHDVEWVKLLKRAYTDCQFFKEHQMALEQSQQEIQHIVSTQPADSALPNHEHDMPTLSLSQQPPMDQPSHTDTRAGPASCQTGKRQYTGRGRGRYVPFGRRIFNQPKKQHSSNQETQHTQHTHVATQSQQNPHSQECGAQQQKQTQEQQQQQQQQEGQQQQQQQEQQGIEQRHSIDHCFIAQSGGFARGRGRRRGRGVSKTGGAGVDRRGRGRGGGRGSSSSSVCCAKDGGGQSVAQGSEFDGHRVRGQLGDQAGLQSMGNMVVHGRVECDREGGDEGWVGAQGSPGFGSGGGLQCDGDMAQECAGGVENEAVLGNALQARQEVCDQEGSPGRGICNEWEFDVHSPPGAVMFQLSQGAWKGPRALDCQKDDGFGFGLERVQQEGCRRTTGHEGKNQECIDVSGNTGQQQPGVLRSVDVSCIGVGSSGEQQHDEQQHRKHQQGTRGLDVNECSSVRAKQAGINSNPINGQGMAMNVGSGGMGDRALENSELLTPRTNGVAENAQQLRSHQDGSLQDVNGACLARNAGVVSQSNCLQQAQFVPQRQTGQDVDQTNGNTETSLQPQTGVQLNTEEQYQEYNFQLDFHMNGAQQDYDLDSSQPGANGCHDMPTTPTTLDYEQHQNIECYNTSSPDNVCQSTMLCNKESNANCETMKHIRFAGATQSQGGGGSDKHTSNSCIDERQQQSSQQILDDSGVCNTVANLQYRVGMASKVQDRDSIALTGGRQSLQRCTQQRNTQFDVQCPQPCSPIIDLCDESPLQTAQKAPKQTMVISERQFSIVEEGGGGGTPMSGAYTSQEHQNNWSRSITNMNMGIASVQGLHQGIAAPQSNLDADCSALCPIHLDSYNIAAGRIDDVYAGFGNVGNSNKNDDDSTTKTDHGNDQTEGCNGHQGPNVVDGQCAMMISPDKQHTSEPQQWQDYIPKSHDAVTRDISTDEQENQPIHVDLTTPTTITTPAPPTTPPYTITLTNQQLELSHDDPQSSTIGPQFGIQNSCRVLRQLDFGPNTVHHEQAALDPQTKQLTDKQFVPLATLNESQNAVQKNPSKACAGGGQGGDGGLGAGFGCTGRHVRGLSRLVEQGQGASNNPKTNADVQRDCMLKLGSSTSQTMSQLCNGADMVSLISPVQSSQHVTKGKGDVSGVFSVRECVHDVLVISDDDDQ